MTFQVSYPLHAKLLASTSNASRRIFDLPSLLVLKYHISHTNVSRMKKFDLSRCFLPAYNLVIYDEPLTRTIYLILVGTNKSYPFPEFYIWVSERKEKMSIFRAELPFLNAQFAPIDQSGVSLRFLCGLH